MHVWEKHDEFAEIAQLDRDFFSFFDFSEKNMFQTGLGKGKYWTGRANSEVLPDVGFR